MDARKRQTSLVLSTHPSIQSRSKSLSSADSPLSEKAISEFQSLYHKKYGIQLTSEDAKAKALNLLFFLRRIGYPLGRKGV